MKKPKCKECRNHKQISNEDFNKLPYELARQLDCKNLVEGGQCCCYSLEHIKDKETLKEIKNILGGI